MLDLKSREIYNDICGDIFINIYLLLFRSISDALLQILQVLKVPLDFNFLIPFVSLRRLNAALKFELLATSASGVC